MSMDWPATLTPATLHVTPERVAAYAEVTQDFNPLHLDAEFAATTPFGGPIAHGTMNLALVWEAAAATFGARARPGRAEVRFSRPAPVGCTLTATGAHLGGGRYAVEVRTEAGEVAVSVDVQMAPA